jgi:Fe-S cluster assembly scaffold protein SufB
MTDLQKSTTRIISEKLGEPSVFYQWREEVFANATAVAENLAYGLSISVDHGVFQNITFQDNGVVYEHVGDASVYSWSDVLSDLDLSEKVRRLLYWSSPKLSKDHYAGSFAGVFSNARVVYLRKGQQGTVRLSSICTSSTSDMVCVIADEQAKLVVIDDVEVQDTVLARTILIQTKEGAKVDYIFSRFGRGSLYATILSDIQTGGELSLTHLSGVVDGVSKLNSESYLTGEGAHVRTGHVAVATHTGVSDVQDIAIHAASHTHSTLGAAGVAKDAGVIVYRSNIIMDTEGTKALSGAQKARFLVMSKDAEIDAIPSLDIAQKDVSCSHSVSVSHLKDDDTFYPRLRGIDKEHAKSMVVEGLLVEPVLHVKDQAHVFEYIEKALQDSDSDHD